MEHEMKLVKPTEGKGASSFWAFFENDPDNKANRSSKDHTPQGPYADHGELVEAIRKVRRAMKKQLEKVGGSKTTEGKKIVKDSKAKMQRIRDEFETSNRFATAFMAGAMTELIIQKVGNEFRVTIARPEGRASHAFKSDPDKVDETINSYRVIADCDLIKFAQSSNVEMADGIYIGTIS